MSQNLLVGGYKEAAHYRSLPQAFSYILFFLPFYIISSYVFIYLMIPRFLFKKKLRLFFVSLLLLLALDFICCYETGLLYIHLQTGVPYDQISFSMNKYQAIVNGIWLPVIILGLTGGIWTAKRWVLQQRENEQLEKQRITAELRLLKKQIHPRFLFHSLHSLQVDLQSGSPDSPALILKLSDLLSYILYESDNETVLLEKEISMIQEYINIEKDNYEARLSIHEEITADEDAYQIAPLLLLPFIEIGFEYLAEKNKLEQFITLKISTEKNNLHFTLICAGSASALHMKSNPQPVLINVQKRLQNLYPHEHQLEIISEAEELTVDLQLTLPGIDTEKNKPDSPVKKIYEPA